MIASSILHCIKEDVHCKLTAAGYVMKEGDERQTMMEWWEVEIKARNRAVQYVQWCKPPPVYAKLNTDGLLKKGRGSWGDCVEE